MKRVPWHLILTALALTGIVTFVAWPALAHDHWINHGDYQDPVNHWRCCGDHDCTASQPSSFKAVDGGYSVPIGRSWEFIPNARIIPSEDQYSYVCRWGSKVNGSDVRCVFMPMPGT